MLCECGHTLKTASEKNDGQCVRCARKAVKGTLGIDWFNVGRSAYQNGSPRAPAMSIDVVGAIRAHADAATICMMFLGGWDRENLAD